MNTLTKSLAKRALSVLLVAIMVFSLGIVGITSTSAANVEQAETGVASTKGSYIYLQASFWDNGDGNERYAAYVWGNDATTWLNFTDIGNGWYSTKVTGTWNNIIFCRMNGANNTNAFTNAWNQTGDLTFENNCFTVTDWGAGTWSYHDTTIYLPGAYSNNFEKNSTSMMNCIAENVFVKELDLSKGSYTFDVYEGDNKFGLDENKRVYESCSGWKLYTNKSNAFNFYAEGGTYKFTYNMSDDKLSVERTSTKTYTSTVHLNHSDSIGSDNWTEETTEFTKNGSVYTYEFKVTGSGNFECGFILDNGKTTEGYLKNPAGGATANDATIAVDSYGENIQLTHPQSGTYTFTLDLSAKTVTVSFTVSSYINFYVSPVKTTVANDQKAYVTPYLSWSGVNVTDESYELFSCDAEGANRTSKGVVPVVTNQLAIDVNGYDPGTYYFVYVVNFNADGEAQSKESKVITVEVTQAEEKTVGLNTATKVHVIAGNSYKIEVTADSPVLAYELYLDGNLLDTKIDGIFEITTTADDIGDERVYTVVAVSNSDGISDGSIDITVTILDPATATSTVTVYFKSAVSYGYRPYVKFGDADVVEMEKAGAIAIGKNATCTGEYWWYSASTTIIEGEPLVLSFSSNSFFQDCTYTLDISNNTTGVYEYYFGIDNLNFKNSAVVNLTDAEYKNAYENATNMIVEPVNEAMAETAANFRMVAVGDANDDGKLNVRDATIIQKDLANITELSEVGAVVADVNGDGKVTIKDATAIQKQLAGL